MLKNTLVRSKLTSAKVLEAAFEELDIAPERRAETLDITEFAALANFLFFYGKILQLMIQFEKARLGNLASSSVFFQIARLGNLAST